MAIGFSHADVRGRHKEVSRILAGILGTSALASAAVGVALLLGADPGTSLWARLAPFALAGFCGLTGIVSSVVRTTITSEAIEIEKGIASLRIPLAEVTSATTEFATPVWDAVLFMAGSKGVLVEWTDASGAHRKALVGADHAGSLAADIQAARSALLRTKVRVEGASGASPREAATDGDEGSDAGSGASESRGRTN